jgi:delta-aminolevulinic acid dehydratase/porphobilinogen synthase
MFIAEGENVQVEIASMPGIFRRSIDLTVKEVQEIYALGIRAVNIYVKSVKTKRQYWERSLEQRRIDAECHSCH